MPTWNLYEVIFDIDNKKKQIDELSSLMSSPGFWDEQERSTKTVKQVKSLKSTVQPWEDAGERYQELKELSEIVK